MDHFGEKKITWRQYFKEMQTAIARHVVRQSTSEQNEAGEQIPGKFLRAGIVQQDIEDQGGLKLIYNTLPTGTGVPEVEHA